MFNVETDGGHGHEDGHEAIQFHTKVYFNEFVTNVLCDNIGIDIFDLRGHGSCWRPKTPLGGQKCHEGVNLLKNVFNRSFSTTSITP